MYGTEGRLLFARRSRLAWHAACRHRSDLPRPDEYRHHYPARLPGGHAR
jgi:hypothetical protein